MESSVPETGGRRGRVSEWIGGSASVMARVDVDTVRTCLDMHHLNLEAKTEINSGKLIFLVQNKKSQYKICYLCPFRAKVEKAMTHASSSK